MESSGNLISMDLVEGYLSYLPSNCKIECFTCNNKFCPVQYDFKKERYKVDSVRSKKCFNKILAKQNPIKQYLLGVKDDIWHCDSSAGNVLLTNKIYEILWGWYFTHPSKRDAPIFLKTKLGLKDSDMLELGADTMNSFLWVFRAAIEIEMLELNCRDNIKDFYCPREGLINFCHPVMRTVMKNEELQKYARLTHSIGNFTLVPFNINSDKKNSFNQYRGKSIEIRDFWDISLYVLKDFFDNKTGGENLFRNFISIFFLDVYTDKNNDYTITPLFKRKSDSLIPQSNPQPNNQCELNDFLRNANKKILARGKVMVNKLREIII